MFHRRSNLNDVDLLNAGYRYAWSLCSNQQDAEDLLQDAWYRLVKRYRRSPEKSLLFTCIRNLYIDSYRKSQKVRFVALEEHHQFDSGSVDSIEKAYLDAEQLQFQMSRLRDKEREALYLSVVEGYTADEIASMTDTARGSVLSLLQRSKAKLRNWLNAEDDQAPANTSSAANVVQLRERKEQ